MQGTGKKLQVMQLLSLDTSLCHQSELLAREFLSDPRGSHFGIGLLVGNWVSCPIQEWVVILFRVIILWLTCTFYLRVCIVLLSIAIQKNAKREAQNETGKKNTGCCDKIEHFRNKSRVMKR